MKHRERIHKNVAAAETHKENPLVAQELERFWAAYDKLVAVVKLVDNGEAAEAEERRRRIDWLKQWINAYPSDFGSYPWHKVVTSSAAEHDAAKETYDGLSKGFTIKVIEDDPESGK